LENVPNIPGIEIPFNWAQVLERGTYFPWHRKKVPKNLPKYNIAGPRVYRWVLRRGEEISSVYIGQSEKFEKRLRDYRRPNPYDCDVQAAMRECEAGGGRVELQFLDLGTGSFRINGKLISHASLSNHDVRMMMESTAIVTARVEGVKLLNHVRDNALVKVMVDLFKQYPETFGPMTAQKKALFEARVAHMIEN
jgi:hypothetical protein